MVPVPEEHAEAVTRYLQKIGQPPTPAEEWGLDAIGAFLSELDEPSRSLLVLAAEASVGRQVLTVPAAAKAIGCSVNEALGMTVALNDAVLAAGGPWFLLAAMPISREAAPRSWSLNMADEAVARAVLDAAGRDAGPER